MIHLDPVLVKLDVRYCKTTKLRNTKAGVEQDEEGIMVAAVVFVLFYEVEEITLLLPGDGFTGHRIVHNDRCQFKLEGGGSDHHPPPAEKQVAAHHGWSGWNCSSCHPSAAV